MGWVLVRHVQEASVINREVMEAGVISTRVIIHYSKCTTKRHFYWPSREL